METIKILWQDVEYCRLPNDINGNPRYYIGLTTIMQYIPDLPKTDDYIRYINKRKSYLSVYRGRQYGYGYVLQSYSVEHDLTKEIQNILSK